MASRPNKLLGRFILIFLQRLNKNHSTGTTEISREAVELLKQYSWPGNVRELENVLHSASVISKGKRILTKDLPDSLSKIQFDNTSSTNQKVIDEGQSRLVFSTDSNFPRIDDNKKDSTKFGETTKDFDSFEAPSSISADEAYDIAYASVRTSTDTNILEIVEKEMIQRSLKECGGNQVKASAMLGITRATLRKRIDAHNIRY